MGAPKGGVMWKPAVVLLASLAALSSAASGQTYPMKPVRIITSPVGGGADFAARLISHGISGPLGQAVVVENRSGVIAKELVAKAAPDGYTYLLDGSALWIEPLMQGKS